MGRRVLLIAITLGALALGAQADPAIFKRSDPVFSQIDAIVKSLAEISGLSEQHPVAYGRMSKRQLRHFLNQRIKRTLKPEEIYADELALKMFGFVPEDFDLRKSTVDLLTEQAAAFYDYDAKKLFLLADSSESAETVTLAHELSHALADQHFNLSNFMDDTPSNDDENLAHSAVVEGEASWLMIAYSLKQGGRAPVPTPEMLATVVDSSDASIAEFPELKGAPLYIQQSLLFPYTRGTEFFDAVYRKFGRQAFARVFTDPPVDSAQIIHPGRYFEAQRATSPSLPPVDIKGSAEGLTEGSVGEFDLEIMLRQYGDEKGALALAPHLRGGRFKITGVGKEHKPLLQYSSEWDSEAAAAQFFGFYPKILAGKWQRFDLTSSAQNLAAGMGDNGFFLWTVSGSIVQCVEGLGDAGEWKRLTERAKLAPTLH